MTFLALILIFLSILVFIVVLQMNYQALKKKHLAIMSELQLKVIELANIQNKLAEKNHLIDTFNHQYKNSKERINQEILGFIYDFLKNNSKK